MAGAFSFKVQGVDKVLALYKKLPVSAQRELKSELKATGAEIRDGAKADAPVNESRLKGSISLKTTGETSFEVVAQTAYAGYLEFGTKTKTDIPPEFADVAAQLKGPGVKGSASPLQAIEKWVQLKGIAGTFNAKTRRQSRSKASKANIKQVAFLIWRHIRKYGINAQPYFFKQIKKAEPVLRQRVANVIKRIL